MFVIWPTIYVLDILWGIFWVCFWTFILFFWIVFMMYKKLCPTFLLLVCFRVHLCPTFIVVEYFEGVFLQSEYSHFIVSFLKISKMYLLIRIPTLLELYGIVCIEYFYVFFIYFFLVPKMYLQLEYPHLRVC